MLTAAIVNYNTTQLTECAIRSLLKHVPTARVVVFDNSDTNPFHSTISQVEVIDNTHGHFINFEAELEKYPDREAIGGRNRSNYGSAKHCMSVDLLMDMLPDGFLLMDSDVLLLKSPEPMIRADKAATGAVRHKRGIMLLQPFICWLNVPMLRDYGIRYFNGQKMWALSQQFPNNRYDTGAWLFEEICNKGLHWMLVDIWQYIVHFGHGSWKEKDAEEWLYKNKELWK